MLNYDLGAQRCLPGVLSLPAGNLASRLKLLHVRVPEPFLGHGGEPLSSVNLSFSVLFLFLQPSLGDLLLARGTLLPSPHRPLGGCPRCSAAELQAHNVSSLFLSFLLNRFN